MWMISGTQSKQERSKKMTKNGLLQPAIKELAKLIKKHNLSYDQIAYVVRQARQETNVVRSRQRKKLPKLLTPAELEDFFKALGRSRNGFHVLMIKLLYSSALRVSELVNLNVADVNIEERRLFIQDSKNGRDRYVDFDSEVQGGLRQYLTGAIREKQVILFESDFNKPYTTRGISKMVKRYAALAKIETIVSPHLFRHQQATKRLNEGMQLKKLRIFLGHASVQTTEIYSHLTSNDVLDAL